MRRTLTIVATALAAALMLVPAAAQARGAHHKTASAADRNGDRIPDRWERRHHLSLKVKQTKRDQDRDGLNNLNEFKRGTNPRKADTDSDGVNDGSECRHGLDPRDRDSDDDGVKDRDEHAGQVTSFVSTTGVLTITLAGGGTVTGKVTDRTEIECKQASATPTTPTAQSSREDESGDDRGDDDGEHHGDSSGPGGGDHGDDDENDEDHEVKCSTSDLVPGAIVHEAELEADGSGAVFHEIELVK